LRYVITPNLHITPLERELFLIDSNEFVQNLNDMSSGQNAKNAKTRTIKLLEIMCEQIEDFLLYVVDLYLNILYYTLAKNNEKIELNYNIPDLFAGYLQTFTDEELIEQVLQVFSSLSYIIYDKKIVNKKYEDSIDTINHLLLGIKSEFLKAKLCNFYAYNLDDLFHDKTKIFSQSFDEALNFMFTCLTGLNKNITLNVVALESIESLIFDDDLKSLITYLVSIHIGSVIEMTNVPYFQEVISNPMFHSFLKNLILNNYENFGDNIVTLFNYFWEKRIVPDIKGILIGDENGVKKNTLLLDNLNCVKGLLSKSQNNMYKDKMYGEVLKLNVYLEKFLNNVYEEDILEMLVIVYNDIKLIPDEYKDSLCPLIELLTPDESNYNFENYHISFIFAFLKNIRDSLRYKDKVLSFLIT
jgi:hypothetical protein